MVSAEGVGTVSTDAPDSALRERKALSLPELSRRSGVALHHLHRAERGEISPTLITFARIAVALDLLDTTTTDVRCCRPKP